jgi:hypothetical protein
MVSGLFSVGIKTEAAAWVTKPATASVIDQRGKRETHW